MTPASLIPTLQSDALAREIEQQLKDETAAVIAGAKRDADALIAQARFAARAQLARGDCRVAQGRRAAGAQARKRSAKHQRGGALSIRRRSRSTMHCRCCGKCWRRAGGTHGRAGNGPMRSRIFASRTCVPAAGWSSIPSIGATRSGAISERRALVGKSSEIDFKAADDLPPACALSPTRPCSTRRRRGCWRTAATSLRCCSMKWESGGEPGGDPADRRPGPARARAGRIPHRRDDRSGRRPPSRRSDPSQGRGIGRPGLRGHDRACARAIWSTGTGSALSVRLGPGLLGRIFDGLLRPLDRTATPSCRVRLSPAGEGRRSARGGGAVRRDRPAPASSSRACCRPSRGGTVESIVRRGRLRGRTRCSARIRDGAGQESSTSDFSSVADPPGRGRWPSGCRRQADDHRPAHSRHAVSRRARRAARRCPAASAPARPCCRTRWRNGATPTSSSMSAAASAATKWPRCCTSFPISPTRAPAGG